MIFKLINVLWTTQETWTLLVNERRLKVEQGKTFSIARLSSSTLEQDSERSRLIKELQVSFRVVWIRRVCKYAPV